MRLQKNERIFKDPVCGMDHFAGLFPKEDLAGHGFAMETSRPR